MGKKLILFIIRVPEYGKFDYQKKENLMKFMHNIIDFIFECNIRMETNLMKDSNTKYSVEK